MNGIVNKLAEVGIDLSADNIANIIAFDYNDETPVYQQHSPDTSKMIVMSGYSNNYDYYYWGLAIFEVNKISKTFTRLSFEESHNIDSISITEITIDTDSDTIRVTRSDGYNQGGCAIFLKS